MHPSKSFYSLHGAALYRASEISSWSLLRAGSALPVVSQLSKSWIRILGEFE